MSKLSRITRFLAPRSALATLAAAAALGGVACGTEAIDPNGAGGTPGASGSGSGGVSGTSTGGSAGSGGSGVPAGTGGESASGGGGGAPATGGASGTGVSGGMAGAGASSGAGGSGGAGATAGATGAGGAGASGASGTGGVDAMGGSAGTSGTAGAAGSAGSSGTAGAAGSPGESPKPYFSFFVTSMDGLLSLATDKVNGFGGDFRFGEQTGLAGADKICATLAQRASPGDTKTWRAFLSTSGLAGGTAVDAIDRVGPGPWYDFNGRLFASNVAGLQPGSGSSEGRPDGDPQLMEMFTDENGIAIQPNNEDNHDTLTGSNSEGRLYGMTAAATCDDWTSSTTHGTVPVGHAWPRSQSNGREWIQDHTVNGCEPGINIGGGGGAPMGDYTVGGGGGFGGFYCFALGALPP